MANAKRRQIYTQERDPVEGGGVGPRAGVDWCGKSPPPGFELRTIQSIASRYTDWAITAHKKDQ